MPRKRSPVSKEDEKKDDTVSETTVKVSNANNRSHSQLEAPKVSSQPNSSPKRWLCITYFMLHIAFIEVPVMILFTGYRTTFLIEQFYAEYLEPLMDLQQTTEDRKPRELTYYHRTCTADDMSATDTPDLILRPEYNMSTDDAMQHMIEHGVSIYPNLLTEETAQEVREFVLRQNQKNEDMIYVIENEHRWSFFMKTDQDPSVVKALTEILSHDFLVESMEKIMGPNPAVIEFTAITSAYGAKVQRYHADVVPEGNGIKWGRTFIPSYSLFIPLQNVTGAMGATDVCPGSHMCAGGTFDYCPQHGFQVSGSNDNWPLGWGALVNQQLMHRGQAHSDPNGPHRVVFIVTFAPRPRFGKYEVETRSIAQGGSYSLHWQHWGHTLRDIANAPKYMAMPWRFIRAMGLWKSRGRQWGWDYITQATSRISNSENGYSYGELLAMLEAGKVNLVFKRLYGNIPEEMDNSRDIWIPFYLSTLHKCRKVLRNIYVAAVVLYVMCVVGGSFLLSRNRIRNTVSKLGRLCITHITIFLLGKLLFMRVANSTYGRNLRGKRSFRWPSSSQSHVPKLPGTLPNDQDVMVFDDMQSDYLASYSDILNHKHPGNKAWFVLMEYYSSGYETLTPAIQTNLCSALTEWSRLQGSRILVKNSQSQWSEATHELAVRFCYKEMIKTTNPYTREIIRQNDFLLMETKFGYWRDTRMHLDHIPSYLMQLQDRIMRTPITNQTTSVPISLFKPFSFPRRLLMSSTLSPRRKVPTNMSSSEQAVIYYLPTEKRSKGTRLSFEEGDKVEAAYSSLMTEWYPATITGVNAHAMTWEVTYEDGEQQSSLCLGCVRSFKPYQVGEHDVECRDDSDIYYHQCHVTASNSDGTYQVLLSNGATISDFRSSDMRRVAFLSNGIFNVGDRVVAQYGDEGLHPGTIGQVNGDGFYGVYFDSGDFVPRLFGRLIASESTFANFDYDDDDDDIDDDYDEFDAEDDDNEE